MHSRKIALASFVNAGDPPADDGLAPTVNAVALPGDDTVPEWLSVPYSDVPYAVGDIVGLQRLNLAVAQRLVEIMMRAMRIEPRLAGGLPVYEHGHPDFYDKTDPPSVQYWLQHQPPAVGWIREFDAAPNALRVRVEWNDDGKELLAKRRYKNWSPFFRSQPTTVETINGKSVQIYEPRIVQSAGLTNTPNWPMPPMVNAAILSGGDTTEGSMDLLQRLIALIGDANIKTEDDAVAAVQRMITALKASRAAIDARWKADDAARMALPNAGDPCALIDGYISHLEGQLLAAQANAASLAASQALAETLGAQLKASRTEYATAMVNAAVSRGAVLQEHAASRIEDMVNAGDAFSGKVAELAALPKLMKTDSETTGVETRSSAIADRRARFHEMVNAAMPANNNDYDAAFAAVAKEHPELLSGGAVK